MVEELCHDEEDCILPVSPQAFDTADFADPCPEYRKYVEVAYKCKPTKFKSRLVCQSNPLSLVSFGLDSIEKCSKFKTWMQLILLKSNLLLVSSLHSFHLKVKAVLNLHCRNAWEEAR